MNTTSPVEKADADWRKADADWRKASANLRKAFAAREKADADWQKAIADWQKADDGPAILPEGTQPEPHEFIQDMRTDGPA